VGKNKLVKFAEMKHFVNVFQPAFQELQQNGFHLKGKWNSLFFGNNNPITVEMGCGKGEYTIEQAVKFPERNFIGIDIKGARMFTGAKQAMLSEFKNVAFVRTKIENCDLLFAQDEISEIWLTFPDPQMKNTRKRMTSTWFLSRYQRFLSPNGVVHLKTDSAFLYNYTLALVQSNLFRITGLTGNLYESELLNEYTGIQTFYEKQWIERGIPIKYLSFIPEEKENLTEPEDDFEKDNYRSFGRKARS
jgi:tRNA (guanine-N7-)-methyltransferase